MRQIFEPAAAAELRWDHWTTLRRRRAHVFAFEVKTANSQYRIDVKLLDGPLETARLGQRGLIYVDRDTRMVLRIVADAEGIPPQFPVQKATSILDYAFTEIGGREFLLPLHALARMQTGALDTKNEVEFQSYRKFNGEATITYDGADPVKR